tara:strand:- start:3241 stop:4371 length:1131 start_codon:yes stop_codon:yes gene_type:complete
MNVLYFSLGKANPNSANGINQVIIGLASNLNKFPDVKVQVLSLSRKQVKPYQLIQRNGFVVHCYNSFKGVLDFISKNNKGYDLVHLHNAWTIENDRLAIMLRKYKLPYIISIHASLTTDRMLRSNYYAKKLYHHLIQSRTFSNALALHATTYEEQLDIVKYSKTKIITHPNGVMNNEIIKKPKTYVQDKLSKLRGLYVGRFAKEKNIQGLINAVALLPQKYRDVLDIDLVGPKTEAVEKLIAKHELKGVVHLQGSMFGEERESFIKNADFFIHTAFSDACPTSFVYALSQGLPAIITRSSMVSYFYKYNAFYMVEPLVEDIARGLKKLIDNKVELAGMSESALKLVNKELNWEVISLNLLSDYEKLLSEYNKPLVA